MTFVSKDALESFYGKLIRPAAKKATVIQNGVDVERIDQALRDHPTPSSNHLNTLKIITIGRCIPQKNQEFLLEVLERLNGDWSLDVYGEGPLSHKLHQSAVEKHLSERIQFHGVVPRDDVYRAIADSDIFVSPSLWEGLPVAMMEAMCVGVPCVVSDIPSHREVGEDTDGVLLTELDVQAWLEHLDYLSGLSPEQRNALGRDNRKIVEERFSVPRMQQQYRELYEELLQEKDWLA